MGDPGLCPLHLISIAGARCARLEGGEVGTGVGLGENGGGQDLAGGDLWEIMRLLFGRAAEADQFCCDFRSGAEGADADIAIRQLFGDHAHRRLAKPKPTLVFRDGKTEHAEIGDGAKRPRRG